MVFISGSGSQLLWLLLFVFFFFAALSARPRVARLAVAMASSSRDVSADIDGLSERLGNRSMEWDPSHDVECSLCENSWSRHGTKGYHWWWAYDHRVDGGWWWRLCHKCAMSAWDEVPAEQDAATARCTWTGIVLQRLDCVGHRQASKKQKRV